MASIVRRPSFAKSVDRGFDPNGSRCTAWWSSLVSMLSHAERTERRTTLTRNANAYTVDLGESSSVMFKGGGGARRWGDDDGAGESVPAERGLTMSTGLILSCDDQA